MPLLAPVTSATGCGCMASRLPGRAREGLAIAGARVRAPLRAKNAQAWRARLVIMTRDLADRTDRPPRCRCARAALDDRQAVPRDQGSLRGDPHGCRAHRVVERRAALVQRARRAGVQAA